MDKWEFDLKAAKQFTSVGSAATEVKPEPTWSARLPLAEKINGTVQHLLQQLPIMRTVTDNSARRVYREQLAKAFIQAAYLEARTAQLSHNLSNAEQQRQAREIFDQCGQQIRQISDWLDL